MQEAVSDIIARRRIQPDGLSRLLSQSVAIHVAAVVLILVAPKWFVREHEKPLIMTISLGGTLGDKSGGMVAASARAVEQVVPPPKRPEPVRPAVKPAPDVLTTQVKPQPKTPPKPEPTTGATAPVPRLATGAQVQRGTSAAETGSTSQSTGLSFGGGAGGALATLDSDFCCKEYMNEVLRRIIEKWDRLQPDTGSTTIVFEINKDGTFSKPEVEKSSGSTSLDLASKTAFKGVKFEPLPKEYPSDKLKIHLTFPYVR